MLEYGRFEVYWDGHATVRIEDEDFTVAVDPFSEVSNDFTADLVLVTHSDAGHFDKDMIERVATGRTCVVIPESMDEDLVPCRDVEKISEGEEIDVYGVQVEATPMDNQLRNHGAGVGYRFRMDDTDFYVAGDTGLVDEFIELEDRVDVAFLPVEGVYTMELDDAVKVAARVKPDLVIPYHYGEPFFSYVDVDLRSFKAELEDRNIDCKILELE